MKAKKTPAPPTPPAPMLHIDGWFASRGWKPFPFQREVWEAYLAGSSGLVHAATGTGKTLAALFGPVLEALAAPKGRPSVVWLSPLKALVADTALSLSEPLAELGLGWKVETRTGDTASSVKTRQNKRLPEILVTTPESLTLLLTQEGAPELFAGLRCVVADEWHELLGTKRGVLAELALARLRGFAPGLRTWGLSATIGNIEEALAALVGGGGEGRVVRGIEPKPVSVDSVLPRGSERFPYPGHLGFGLLPEVLGIIEGARSCLVFTNTRSQTEIWHRAILAERPDWADEVAVHHGSLDRNEREFVELGLKLGKFRCVVCTSSLDLGVDFPAVDRVVQIGSARGVARLLQRAGRSGHGPGLTSRVTCVPTHAFELLETAAARDAALAGDVEERWPLRKPMDVMVQHLVTAAMGGGFEPAELLAEVRTTRAYRQLSDGEWAWVMDFVANGGRSLKAYPEYRRLTLEDGRYTVTDKAVATRHRMSVGAIVSETSMTVALVSGKVLGTLEEGFVSRLAPGDRFAFAGRVVELVRIREMTAWVRPAQGSDGLVPRWSGSRLPLSRRLAEAVRQKFDEARRGVYACPEMQTVRPVLELQAAWSSLPGSDELLVERLVSREGHHVFLYPFEGRHVHEALATLFARRLARARPSTIGMAVNDYGLELISSEPLHLEQALEAGLLASEGLREDIVAGLNSSEMARRVFREIARVAGLVFQGYPGRGKTARQLQSSSNLFFEVFLKYDPDNLLLKQAFDEAVDGRLEEERLLLTLERLRGSRLVLREPSRLTPLSFPLTVERLRDQVTTEKLSDRVRSMQLRLERAADRTYGKVSGEPDFGDDR